MRKPVADIRVRTTGGWSRAPLHGGSSMTLKAGFQFAEAQLLLEMAQQAYAGTPSLTEAVATCGARSARSKLELDDPQGSHPVELHVVG